MNPAYVLEPSTFDQDNILTDPEFDTPIRTSFGFSALPSFRRRGLEQTRQKSGEGRIPDVPDVPGADEVTARPALPREESTSRSCGVTFLDNGNAVVYDDNGRVCIMHTKFHRESYDHMIPTQSMLRVFYLEVEPRVLNRLLIRVGAGEACRYITPAEEDLCVFRQPGGYHNFSDTMSNLLAASILDPMVTMRDYRQMEFMFLCYTDIHSTATCWMRFIMLSILPGTQIAMLAGMQNSGNVSVFSPDTQRPDFSDPGLERLTVDFSNGHFKVSLYYRDTTTTFSGASVVDVVKQLVDDVSPGRVRDPDAFDLSMFRPHISESLPTTMEYVQLRDLLDY